MFTIKNTGDKTTLNFKGGLVYGIAAIAILTVVLVTSSVINKSIETGAARQQAKADLSIAEINTQKMQEEAEQARLRKVIADAPGTDFFIFKSLETTAKEYKAGDTVKLVATRVASGTYSCQAAIKQLVLVAADGSEIKQGHTAQVNDKCTIESGEITFNSSYQIPQNVEPGAYKILFVLEFTVIAPDGTPIPKTASGTSTTFKIN